MVLIFILICFGWRDTENQQYGEAPPERITFFSLQVYERVGILKRPKRANKLL